MADPTVRRENILREDRIKFLSDVLLLAHKHKDYIKRAGNFDSVTSNIENLKKYMEAARRIRREPIKASFKQRETTLIRTGLEVAFGKLFNSTPNVIVRVGGKPDVIVHKSKATFTVTVGWMWGQKVYAPLYQGCTTRYGKHVILSAEKRRVNQKWIELYEVTAYDHDTKSLVNGFVTKTKTDRKNTAFSTDPVKAVNKAIELMQHEMNAQLVRKGSEND